MGIAITLKDFLDQEGVEYELLPHPHTSSSMQTAEAAHVPGDQLAKSVLLEDDGGYLMAVIPATHRVEIGAISHQLNRRLGLATETEVGELFEDCELGAIPPVGNAYGVDVILDDSLTNCPDVYFEAGDHTEVVHVSGEDFQEIMHKAHHGHISRHL